MTRLPAVAALLLLALLPCAPAQSAVGGELAQLEDSVNRLPHNGEARRQLAAEYEARGFVEEAVAQCLAVLALDRADTETGARLTRLVQQQMPAWLPAEASTAPFTAAVHAVSPTAEGAVGARGRFLLTTALEAKEGQRRDRLHGWLCSRVLYGYVWEEGQQRWLMAARAHFPGNEELARASLHTVLALSLLVPAEVQLAAAHTPPQPVDLWLAEKGEPGAQTVGRDIYLYAVGTARPPEEWLREVAHEYGHAALPGIGGFTQTDDPWADGELGELLFVKWLAAAQAEQFPWPIPTAEAIARARREQLMAAARRPDPALLARTDARARDHFLGLALRLEAAAGPRFLGEVLVRCPHGTAPQFVVIAEKLAKPRGIEIGW